MKGPTVTLTVRQLAEKVRGELAGDGELPISNARTLAEARLGDITFVDAERHLPAWHNCQASAAIVPLGTAVNGRPVIRVKDPLAAFAAVVLHFRDFRPSADTGQVAPSASIHPTATLGAGTTVGPFAVIGEGAVVGARCHVHSGVSVGRFCKIGDDTTLYPHVILYDDCVLGNRVIVHANAVLGADGFGYRTQAGKHVKVPQLGNVEVEDDVEIGACTTIDRGTFGPTRIGTGTKIDNLVQIGHNCQIGRHNLLCSQVGVAGSCTTGDYVVMAGQVGIADHVTVADKAMIGAKAGVVKDVAEGSRLLGYPARPDKESLRIFLTLDKLPDLIKDMKKVKHSLGMGEGE